MLVYQEGMEWAKWIPQPNAEASLGFHEIDRLSGYFGLRPVPYPVFASWYVCPRLDRFWSFFFINYFFPNMQHADILLSDCFF